MCSGRIALLAVTLATLNACRGPELARSGECPRVRFGACVSPAIADATCGARRASTLAGCLPKPACEPGRARDLTSGECLAHRESRAIATSVGVLVEDDTVLACENDGTLASGVADNAARLGCLPPEPPLLECPPGAVALAAACVPIRPKNGPIDVVTWSRAVLGDASSPLCTALQDSPGALVVAASVENPVQLELSFPDNDITQVVVAARSPGVAQGELDHAVAPLVEALRSLGGTANQAFVSLSVSCRRTSERPRTISSR